MAELILEKTARGVLIPAEPQGIELLQSWKVGTGVRCEVTKIRSYQFHKKLFALLETAFALWQPESASWAGVQGEKDFDTFREQVTILAGFHHVVIDVRGNAKVKAKSISFANMDDLEFERVYRGVFHVCWKILLKQSNRWTPAALENAIANIESFA